MKPDPRVDPRLDIMARAEWRSRVLEREHQLIPAPSCMELGAGILALLAFTVFVVSGRLSRAATRPASADAKSGIGALMIGAAGCLDRQRVQAKEVGSSCVDRGIRCGLCPL